MTIMKHFALILFVCFSVRLSAQQFPKKYRYWSAGFNLNAMNYLGELDPSPGFISPGVKFTRYNIGLSLSKKITPSFSYRLAVSHGMIEGNDYMNASYNAKDINRKIRNLSFRNSIWEIKVDIVKDLLPNRGKPTMRHDFVPYFFSGIAYFYHNPKARLPEEMGGQWVALQPLRLEGKAYSLHQIAIPAGLGFRYKLNQRWDVAFEIGWRFTFTDYLDDVSGNYKGRENFAGNSTAIALSDRSIEGIRQDPVLQTYVNEVQGYNSQSGYTTVNGYGREGDQRGDPGRKDWYIISGFHFTYILFSKVVRCPPRFRVD